MDDQLAKKLIGKLTTAVISLSVLAIVLILLITSLLSRKQVCGTAAPKEKEGIVYCATVGSSNDFVFKQNCSSCHFVNSDMTGPAPSGISIRQPYDGWFEEFLRNEDSLIQAKEPYTLYLREKWPYESWTHNYKALNDVQMQELKAYLQKKNPVAIDTTGFKFNQLLRTPRLEIEFNSLS